VEKGGCITSKSYTTSKKNLGKAQAYFIGKTTSFILKKDE
jgi:hypothetical protein